MRSDDRTDAVDRGLVLGQIRLERGVDRFLERLETVRHRHHGRAQEPHTADVRRLLLDVDLAHVDLALEAEVGGRGARVTPCWPAPVSAMTFFLPMHLASRPSPIQWFGLWAPVWLRSSRLR